MRTFRRLMISIVAIGILAAATPSFAQTGAPTSGTPLKLKIPSFAPSSVVAAAPTTPAPVRLMRVQDDDSGLGVFIQGGFIRSTTWGENGIPTQGLSDSFPGFIVGVGFGGNKSGLFGIGADVNYLRKRADNVEVLGQNFPLASGALTLHYVEVPVWGRFNFGSRARSGATFYVMFGGFIDILLKGDLDNVDIKDQFNGFDAGPLLGAGFEIARIGFEYRANWAMRTLQSTDNGTFLNGLEESKAFTHVFLVKIRLN